MNLAVVNLLWVIFNIPIIVFTLYMLLTEVNITIILVIAFFLILLLFPATSAMYASVRDCVVHRDQRASIKKYWAFYKENYVRSLGIGLLMITLWAVWSFNMVYFLTEGKHMKRIKLPSVWSFNMVYFLTEGNLILFICFLFIGIIYFVYNVNIFILNVHYHYSYLDLIINAFFITFGSIKLFLSIIIGFVFVVSVSLLIAKSIFMLFIIFFTGSLFSLVSFAAFYRYYLKYSTEE